MVDKVAVQIRPATKKDLPALEWEGRYLHFRKLYQRALSEADHGRAILLVAEVEQGIVGQIFVQFRGSAVDANDRGNSGYLYSFRVRPSFRDQGIGTLLMERSESELIRRDFRRVVIAVAKDNKDALRLYKRLGYSYFARDPGEWSYVDHEGKLRHITEPAFVLEKSLPTLDQSPGLH